VFVENDVAHFRYNAFGAEHSLPPMTLTSASHQLALEYEKTGARTGRGRLLLDGISAGQHSELSLTLSYGVFEGLDIGCDRRAPVIYELYERRGTFRYSNAIAQVVVTPVL
jgi:arylsulfatase